MPAQQNVPVHCGVTHGCNFIILICAEFQVICDFLAEFHILIEILHRLRPFTRNVHILLEILHNLHT